VSPGGWRRSASIAAVHEWLSRAADGLAREAGLPRERLELGPRDVETLLDLAGRAAHESGARTNAPLLCYVLGLAAAGGTSLDQLAETLRSTS
jgi:Domain of unknown function (DUF6457)